ncbi:hypothetical protein INR49_007648 [Caranx melampygus]|nr:hypothetical protein INR49_007648 [Caranx melampygus]
MTGIGSPFPHPLLSAKGTPHWLPCERSASPCQQSDSGSVGTAVLDGDGMRMVSLRAGTRASVSGVVVVVVVGCVNKPTSKSTVDADEIKRLGKRFKKLDLDNSGSLSVEEFMSLPELQQNPLVQRVIDIFDTDGNGEVDFKEFIEGVSQFSVKGDKEQKLRCK